MSGKQSTDTQLAVMQTDINYIKSKLNEVDVKVSSHYVSKDEFEPIKRLVYGMVTVILIAVVGAMVSTVVTR